MDTLEEIKKKKLMEMQQPLQQQQKEDVQHQQLQQQLQQIEVIAKSKLTKQALERYGNIKTAHPGLAQQVTLMLAQIDKEKVDDHELKKLLMLIQKEKREFKITRK